MKYSDENTQRATGSRRRRAWASGYDEDFLWRCPIRRATPQIHLERLPSWNCRADRSALPMAAKLMIAEPWSGSSHVAETSVARSFRI